MPEDIESYLFIGGIMDGRWFNVPKSARRWNIPYIKYQDSNLKYFKKDLSDLPESVPYEETKYFKFRLAPHFTAYRELSVFVHESLWNNYDKYAISWDVMCKLVNNYKVIK